MTLQEFLSRNRIETAVWEQSALTWELLQAIGADHDEHRERLRDSAEFFARVIQRFPGVHSVRWRIVTFHHIEANPFSAFKSHPVFGIYEPVRFRHLQAS